MPVEQIEACVAGCLQQIITLVLFCVLVFTPILNALMKSRLKSHCSVKNISGHVCVLKSRQHWIQTYVVGVIHGQHTGTRCLIANWLLSVKGWWVYCSQCLFGFVCVSAKISRQPVWDAQQVFSSMPIISDCIFAVSAIKDYPVCCLLPMPFYNNQVV